MATPKKYTLRELQEIREAKKMNAVARMTAFYRANPHRFAKDYLNINLRLFQKILIFMMNWSTHFIFFASRGLGKKSCRLDEKSLSYYCGIKREMLRC